MSHENVETVKGIYAEWEKGNFRAALPVLDREITFETFMPDSNEIVAKHGLDRLDDFMRDWFGQWEDYRLIADEIQELDEAHVLGGGHHTARGRQSGIPVRDPAFTLWRFRDGRVTRLIIGRDCAKVVRAAGLSE